MTSNEFVILVKQLKTNAIHICLEKNMHLKKARTKTSSSHVLPKSKTWTAAKQESPVRYNYKDQLYIYLKPSSSHPEQQRNHQQKHEVVQNQILVLTGK